MIQLTTNFSQAELGLVGCSQRLIDNGVYLCKLLLEPIRLQFAASVIVHDGYRDPHHNVRVGGKPTSFHLFNGGKSAADFDVIGHSYQEVFDWIRLSSNLLFDKVILESNSSNTPAALHIQIDVNNIPRRQAFTGSTGDGTTYIQVEVR